jgi:hypothetical protein
MTMSTPTPNPPVNEIATIIADHMSNARNIDVRANNGVLVEKVVAVGDELLIFLSNGASLKAKLNPFARATKAVG